MTDGDNLDLQKRSRRRLVGAVALALLAAIVLPMVMDDEPGFDTPQIDVVIPSRDADGAALRPIAGRPVAAAEAEIAVAPLEQAPGTDDLIDEAPPDAAVTSPAAAVPAAPQDRTEQKPALAAAPVPAVVQPPASIPEEKRVLAILEGKAGDTAAAGGSGAAVFAVQVGAFGEATKAQSLSADLSKKGFSAYTERAGPVTRVRVGPFSSKSEAEQAAGRLRSLNLSAVVTAR